ncbi:MAG: universal stress protein [Gammaproteobacteria bacterium]|nr:universal stress protein [Gammaproteobacteria bacterium]
MDTKIYNFKKVLVPVDFSDPAVNALQCAAAVARQFEGEIVLVFVVEMPAHTVGAGVVLDNEAETKRQVDVQMERLIATHLSGVVSRPEIRMGVASEEILKVALEEDADLIIMATHGHSLVRRPLGSVAERVVRHAQRPVLTIPHLGAD